MPYMPEPGVRAEWALGPIASPRLTPRPATVHSGMRGGTPRATLSSRDSSFYQMSRPDQLKGLYYNTMAAQAQDEQEGAIRFWDSFVAKQNSRAGARPAAACMQNHAKNPAHTCTYMLIGG